MQKVCTVLTSLFCVLVTLPALSQNYSIDWFAVAGGGGTSAGGNYSLSGTIGQALAGSSLASSSFSVYCGFWSLFAPPEVSLLLPPQQNWVIDVLTTLRVTNAATTARDPSTSLTYRFLNAPVGARIDTNGLIAWTPSQAQGPSTNAVTTVVTDGGTPPAGATNSFVVVVRGLYEGIDLTDPTTATADPAGDGFPNLLKYALGIDPANPGDDKNGLTISLANSGGGQYLSLTFRRRRNTPWLGYIPEVSADRQTWFSDSAHVREISTVPLDDQFDSETVQDLTPITPSFPRFIRLRVASN